MRVRLSGSVIAGTALLAGCGPFFGGGWSSYPPSGPDVVVHRAVAVMPPSIPVTAAGRIGPLLAGHSTRADVVAFLGRPNAENTDRYAQGPGFEALGYGCKRAYATKDGAPLCTTVFYFPTQTGKLALMWTTSHRYAYRLIHPGVPTASATSVFGGPPGKGCLETWSFAVHALPLTKSNTLGVLDCIPG